MTKSAPEIEKTLYDFGNTINAIPYYAVYRPGKDPHHFNGDFFGAKAFLNKAGIDASVGKAKPGEAKSKKHSTVKFDQLPAVVADPAG